MSKEEFDNWLLLVGRLLGLNERQRKQISEELRDHLESRVADLVESGMDRQTAVMKAVEEFGDAAVLAKNLQTVSLANRKRWMMRFMTLATAGLFLVALLTMAMWPENARFGSPSRTVAQDESVAVSAEVTDDPFNGDSFSSDDPFGSNNSGSVATTTAAKKPEGKPSERSLSNSKIREQLAKSIDLIYDSEPFGDVRRQLSQDLQINIVIDSKLEGVLDDDTEFSIDLRGVRLSDGLRIGLKPHEATYAIKGGVLVIILADDEQQPEFLSRHLIDVRELLRLIKVVESDRVGKPIASGYGGGGGFGGGGFGGGGGVFCVAPQGLGGGGLGGGMGPGSSGRRDETVLVKAESEGEHQNEVKYHRVLTAEQLLVDTVTRVVRPEDWSENGGGCDMTCIGGVMVVLSHESLAEEVRDFVTDLEYQMKNRDD